MDPRAAALFVSDPSIRLIGPALHSPFQALRPMNAALYVDLGWGDAPFAEPAFPPVFVSAEGRLPDVAGSSGHPVWSARLVEAIASAGPFHAKVIRAEVRVKGRRTPITDAYYLMQPARILRGAFDLARCEVEVDPVTQGFLSATRLALRAGVEVPGSFFGISELGELGVSTAAARAIAAIQPTGLWMEPIDRYSTERPDPRPLWEAAPGLARS